MIDFICALTPAADGRLEMHEQIFQQLLIVQDDLCEMQYSFRELILQQDKDQPPSLKLPRTSDRYLYGLHVRLAETCEHAMSKYYECHAKQYRLESRYAELRSNIQGIVNWALFSEQGGPYELSEDNDFDPRDYIRRLQPSDTVYSERLGSFDTAHYTQREKTHHLLTGKPAGTGTNWEDQCRQVIDGEHRSLQSRIHRQQSETAFSLKKSTGKWVPGPGRHESGGFTAARNQLQNSHCRALVPLPISDIFGGGCNGCSYCEGCNCPASGTNVQINQRLVGGYYRENRTEMNYLLWEVQKSTNWSEAWMLRINQYVGFMTPRSTHDSPFFRELVNRRSRTQERLAKWLRTKTRNDKLGSKESSLASTAFAM